MQFTYAAISALLASVAYSQSIASEVAQLPSCALACLSTASSGAGCSITDFACQCGDAKNAITKAATPCIAAGCSASDTLTAQKVATEICALQAAGGSSGSSAAASSTQASSSSTSGSASSSAVSNISSAGSSIASATSAASSSISSALSSASSAISSAASSTSSPTTVSTAAGSRVNAAGAIVGAGFLAAFAL
ncbi:hypothetical protein BTUL_0178g00170 [Botrytis tulipae]|uniref:CFEM domain-containing protein n=1 Tax=Botrytis tulipae TaxID=87230 RepID=A0A4Z1EIC0_9HELO|nr:hypothetical protein BTUL_0178g00170 [Botrytis tulipae]